MNVLIGDLGGTKTMLAIVSDETGPRELLHERTFPSAQYASLEAIIREYLRGNGVGIDQACLAVAGPITNGRASITNLSWIVDSESLRSSFELSSVTLINDLESVAYAIPVLEASDILNLHEGLPVQGGNIAVIAPGTGLGEAFLTMNGSTYHAHASEGSHVSFGPANQRQIDLLTYMREKKGFDHVSYERVCSGGLGFSNLYDFLRDTGCATEPEWLKEELAGSNDPAPMIVQAAQNKDNPCEICIATLDLFRDILAVEAGNLALKVLATGGIYLGGGISPRILEQLQKTEFLEELWNKGRFRDLVAKMPIKVILNPKAGLVGAASVGLRISSKIKAGVSQARVKS